MSITESKSKFSANSLSILSSASEPSRCSPMVDLKYVFVNFSLLKDRSLVAEEIAIVPIILYRIVKIGYAFISHSLVIISILRKISGGLSANSGVAL